MKIQIFLIAAAALLLSGCGNYAGKEKTHPVFVKAGSCKVSGDYKEAAKYFEQFLMVCPQSAVTHYELGSLYGDHLNDSASAVFHYKKYLELSGGKTQDAADVQNMISAAEKKLFAELSKKYESPETAKAVEELKKNREVLQQWIQYSKKLRSLYDELRAQNEEMRSQIKSGKVVKERPRQTAGPQQSNKQAQPAAASPQQAKLAAEIANPAGTEKIYTVKSGDTLSKISRKVYGSDRYHSLILNANKKTIPNGRLRPGQKLVIPQLPSPGRK